jgi:predicted dehydrogenase
MRRKAALIGTGGIANAHAAAIRTLDDRVDLAAAVDIDAAKLADFCDRHDIANAYTDIAEMLDAHRPDYVHICTPPATHCDLILQCLEAGAWVLCEKPLCASLAEMDRIEAAEQTTGRYVSSIFQRRYGAGAHQLKQMIADGALGRPLTGICQTTWYRDDAYYAVPWRGKWKTEIGGTTMIHGIHQMDMGVWLLGEWQEITAMAGTLNHDIEVEDVAMACIRFENGALLSVINSAVSPREETYMRLDFERATVELRYLYDFNAEDWVYTFLPGQGEQPTLDEAGSKWMFVGQLAAFLDSMDRGERPSVSGAEVRAMLECLAAMYKSAFTRQMVPRGTITPDDPFYHAMNGET